MMNVFCFYVEACNDIDRWPTPCPGKILMLPIMGVVMKVLVLSFFVRDQLSVWEYP